MHVKQFQHLLIIIFGVLLWGCGGEIPSFNPTSTIPPTATLTPTSTATSTPTATPLPPVGIFLSPPDAPPSLAAEMQSLVSEGISGLGYRFQVRPSLTDEDFRRDDIRMVIAIPPGSNITDLIKAHPETQFLTVGILDLQPAPNLTAIGSDGNRLDQQGFVAGYIAAMVTADWRVGVIGFSDSRETVAARQAFFTGVKYYCGLCRPNYAPFYEYPLYFELGLEADSIAWRTAADYMIQRFVETVYIVPGAGDDAMLRYLMENEINIIAGMPPLPDNNEHWVVSLQFDLMEMFKDTWPAFLSDSAEQMLPIPMQFRHINPEILTPGKQRLANQVMEDVLAGYIDLGVEPTPSP